MKTLVFALGLLTWGLGIGISHSDEVITPIATFSGKHPDTAVRATLPTSGVVNNQESLAKLWTTLGVTDPMPKIDWKTDIIVVDSVGGPNNMRLGTIKLSAEGELKFASMSTRMGGPGFGYVLAQIPNKGIKSVNGKPIPMAEPNGKKPGGAQGDMVTINIVGKIQTGMMAIGGETTGTVITSANMTFEIDLTGDRGLKAAVVRINGKRGRVIGRLTKRPGVEIPVRWIIKATSIEAVGAPNQPVEIPPVKEAFEEIKFLLSGGIAGLDEELTVTKTGKVTNVNRRARVTESFDFPNQKVNSIHQHIAKTDWSKIQSNVVSNEIADGFSYQFTIDTGGRVFRFNRDDSTLIKTPALRELSKLLRK